MDKLLKLFDLELSEAHSRDRVTWHFKKFDKAWYLRDLRHDPFGSWIYFHFAANNETDYILGHDKTIKIPQVILRCEKPEIT